MPNTSEKILYKILYALESWLEGGDYDEIVSYGRKLDALQKYLPREVKTSPHNRLHRYVLVKTKALDKCLHKDKPLVLKNRKYSSWTRNTEVAWSMLDVVDEEEDTRVVILQHKFSSSDILLNVPDTLNYIAKQGIEEAEAIADEYAHEQEVIIKNNFNNFKFTLKNIFVYEDEEGEWIYPNK